MLSVGLAVIAATFSPEAIVTSATGDWSNIPLVSKRGNLDGTVYIIEELERIAASGECRVRGLSRRYIQLDVPFLIEFNESGGVHSIVVRKLDCPAAETAFASAVMLLAERGEYHPPRRSVGGWYRGALNVASVAAPAPPLSGKTSPEESSADEKLICRKWSETGSRTAKKKRMCMTQNEWEKAAIAARDAWHQYRVRNTSGIGR